MKHLNASKIAFLALLVVILQITQTQSEGQMITNIGQLNTANFSIEGDATTAPHTQNATGINFNSSFPAGATLGGLFTTAIPKDWSSYSLNDFGLVMDIVGVNPNMAFTIEFYDSSLGIANTFQGSTTSTTGSGIFMPVSLSTPGLNTMNDIVGLQFTWDAPDSINATWKEIGVVPEPSTLALLGLTLGLGTLIALKRQRIK